MGHIVAMDDSPAQLALTAYAGRLWRDLAPSLGRRCEVDFCGTLWIAEDDAQRRLLTVKQQMYADAGMPTALLSQADVADAEPNLRRDLAGALRVAGDAVVYPPTVTLALLERARADGATIRCAARALELLPNAVRTEHETIHADVVVNAAGISAAELTPQLPIVPRKGHLAITDRYPGFCRHQIVEVGYVHSAHAMTGESVAFNLQPRATGQVLIGSSRELVGMDAAVNPRILQRMLNRAMSFMPALRDLSVIRTWTGFRPATADSLPLIGRWEPTPGLWIAAGHEGLGVTTSLATAGLLCDLIAGRTTQIDPVPFSPTRALTMAQAGSSNAPRGE